jgi:hypothetical protein
MRISDSLAVSANVSLKTPISGDEVLEIFHSGIVPDSLTPNIGILFAEVSPSRFAILFSECGITLGQARKIYEAIPDFYHTPVMEDLLYGDMGNSA